MDRYRTEVDAMTVGRICSRELDLAEAGESVHAAAGRMLQRNVGTLVVPGPRGNPIGILTDRDLVLRVLARGLDGKAVTVREVMTEHPRRVGEDMSLESALSVMESGGFRRLPVVDSRGALVGLVSLDDILVRMANGAAMISSVLAREGPRALRAT